MGYLVRNISMYSRKGICKDLNRYQGQYMDSMNKNQPNRFINVVQHLVLGSVLITWFTPLNILKKYPGE